MLALHLLENESVLLSGEFELTFVRHMGHFCAFRIRAIKTLNFQSRYGDAQSGARVRADHDMEFVVRREGRICVGRIAIGVRRWRKVGVKLAIDAPREVKITRPAQHGSSVVGG